MVQCDEGHLFCRSCTRNYASERLGMRISAIKCMDQEGCSSLFSLASLKICLPEKLMMLYERVKTEEEVTAAGLEGLEECPFCDYKCVIENDMERLFTCLNDDGGCGVVSCRECKKPVCHCFDYRPYPLSGSCRIIYRRLVLRPLKIKFLTCNMQLRRQ